MSHAVHSMATIRYNPLDRAKSEIRLIKLLPRATNSSHEGEPPPHCDLVHVSLDDNPKYAALSYTWGDPRDTQTIIVGNTPVPVTRNLHSAMHHLRPSTTPKTIWIDAICINQSDNQEKSWQVQLMREIYERADYVAVWLGPADATSDAVMEFLHSFGTRAKDFGLDSSFDSVRTQWRKLASDPPSFRDRSKSRVTVKSRRDPEETLEFQLEALNELYYSISGSHEQDHLLPVNGMANLFTHSWWSRTWVLQEITLAQKAGFVCGTKWLSRRRCSAAINAFCALRSVLSERAILRGIPSTAYQRAVGTARFDVRPAVMLGMSNTLRYSPFPLLALLRATCIGEIESSFAHDFHHLETTDPRDKVYGLLGLAADRDELKALGVEPNYTQSCREVYTCVTAAMLRQGHISLLCLCQFPKAQVELPSWVPDWSKPLKLPLQRTSNDHMTIVPKYRASGALRQKVSFHSTPENTMAVSVSGFVYDKIHEVGITWAGICAQKDSIPRPFVWGKRWLTELIRLIKLRGKLYKDLGDRVRAAARTATAGIGFNDNGSWERVGDDRFRAAAMLLNMKISGHVPDEKVLPESGFLEHIASERLQPDANGIIPIQKLAAFIGEIDAKGHGRKPFVSEKGHLGLGPIQLKPGDLIALSGGADMPFVLRQNRNGRYQLIGEAYVDGIMDGEVVVGRGVADTIELH